ncbi:MAG: hypothetical protein QOH37_3644 [Nocardioidaceae bacterium]|nr:hypothetical protein [Nocardioidaceae bacterium]
MQTAWLEPPSATHRQVEKIADIVQGVRFVGG